MKLRWLITQLFPGYGAQAEFDGVLLLSSYLATLWAHLHGARTVLE